MAHSHGMRRCIELGAAGLVLVVSVIASVGWVTAGGHAEHLPLLVRDFKVNIAVGLAVLAVSWIAPRCALACAVAVGALAAVTIAEFIAGVHPGIDQLIAADDSDRHGRMRLAAALCLVGLAVARMLLIEPGLRRARLAEAISFATLLTSSVATIGYVFEEAMNDSSDGLGFLPLLSSLSLLILSLVCLARVPGGFGMWLIAGNDSGALLLRRVLPVSVLAVPAITVAAVLAVRFELLPAGIAAPIVAVAIMLVVTLALARTARALRISDLSRDRATEALTAVNYDLEARILERAEQLRAEHTANDILLERDRIAADMHDHVIQRLYALGMDLERRSAGAGFDADVTIDGLDSAIADLRRTIHDLRTAPAAHGLETELRALGDAVTTRFADGAGVAISGDLDAISGEVSLHLLAVAREAISNAVRHSGAQRLDVNLTVDDAGTALTVTDDGRGIPDGIESTSGLRNMRERAARCGGMATWQSRAVAGTVMNWFVPAQDAARPEVGPAMSVADAVSAYAATAPAGGGDAGLVAAATHLMRLVGADAAIALTVGRDGMRAIWSSGYDLDSRPDGSVFPLAGSLSGHVATTRKPVRVAQVAQAPVAPNTASVTASFGPVITLPVATTETVHGVVALLRAGGADSFTLADEQAAELFATCVAALFEQRSREVTRPTLSGAQPSSVAL